MAKSELERIAQLETKVDGVEKKVDKLEDTSVILGRMEIILSQQVEMNKDQHVTLNNINENLSNMNVSQMQMQEEMKTMSNRIEKVEDTQKIEQEKNVLDLSGLPKKAILWAVGVGLGALSLYVYIKLGLK